MDITYLHVVSTAAGKVRRPACFMPVTAINKPDFLAGSAFFYETARKKADVLADRLSGRD